MSKFDVSFNSNANKLVEKITEKIKSKGGSMTGDDSEGEFEITSPVTIRGKYKIVGQKIEIDITKKPIFVTSSMVESEISKDFQKIDGEIDEQLADS